MMKSPISSLTCLLLLCATANAQSFNVDFEHASHGAGPLPDTYGGAPFLQGRWQKATFPVTGAIAPTPLLDVNGVSTGVTVESDSTGFSNSPTCSPIWLADDINMYDGVRRTGGALRVNFRGLQRGLYDVYVYGVDQSGQSPGAMTQVRLYPANGAPGVLQHLAECAGAHTSLRTFLQGQVFVDAGELGVRLNKGFSGTNTSFVLSAIQLDFRIGSSFCATTPNSTGAVSNIRAHSSQTGPDLASVGGGDLTLAANNIPQGETGFFIYSMARHPGTGGYRALGDGYRCLLGAVGRMPLADTQLSPGYMVHTVDYSSPPTAGLTILAGTTWHFQGVYTDSGPAGFNLTNALTIAFGM